MSVTPKEFRSCKVTLSHFSPLGIVFTSRSGAFAYQVALGAIGTFATILGMADVIIGITGSRFAAIVVLTAGLILISSILFLRWHAPEISFIAATRRIVGLAGHQLPVPFQEIAKVIVLNNEDVWQIVLVLKSGESIILVDDYPLNIAIRVATRIGSLASVPVRGDRDHVIRSTGDREWELPYALPSAQFPMEYLLIAGSLAGAVSVLLTFKSAGVFTPEGAARWLCLPAFAIPGGRILSNLQENRGFQCALRALIFGLVFFVVVPVWSLWEPAMTFWGLIPVFMAAPLLVSAYLEKRRMRIRASLAAMIIIPGLIFSFFISYHYHSFFAMDPAFVETVAFEWGDGRQMKTAYPYEVQSILRALQKGQVQRTSFELWSEDVNVEIVRPAGRDYRLTLHREGKGSRTQAVYRLYCIIMNRPVFLGTVASGMMDDALESVDSLTGYWPPGY